MTTTRLRLENFSGATDAGHLEKALEAVSGVDSIELEPDQRMAVIRHDGADVNELTAAVKQLGYRASVAD